MKNRTGKSPSDVSASRQLSRDPDSTRMARPQSLEILLGFMMVLWPIPALSSDFSAERVKCVVGKTMTSSRSGTAQLLDLANPIDERCDVVTGVKETRADPHRSFGVAAYGPVGKW